MNRRMWRYLNVLEKDVTNPDERNVDLVEVASDAVPKLIRMVRGLDNEKYRLTAELARSGREDERKTLRIKRLEEHVLRTTHDYKKTRERLLDVMNAEKNRAEAMEKDLNWLMNYAKERILPCEICGVASEHDMCAVCAPRWRGPCEENGGVEPCENPKD